MKNNVIEALVKKDFALLKKQLGFIFIYLLIFGVGFGAFSEDYSFVSSFLLVMIFIIGINTFIYDEQVKFDKYIAATPATNTQIVLSRYISSTVLGVGGATINYVLTTILLAITRKPIVPYERFVLTMFNIETSIIVISLVLPFIYKFGATKGRLVIIVAALIPAVLIGILTAIVDMESVQQWVETLVVLAPYVVMVLSIVVAIISIKISVKILNNKQY